MIKVIEEDFLKVKKDRELLEREMQMDKKMKEVMESAKEMERKVEAAMEQMKILDFDFDGECNERKQLVAEVVKIIKGKVSQSAGKGGM
jgi:hypothetical protein